jgi:hypothetical protein
MEQMDTSRSEVVLDALFTKVATPLYEGCSSSMLSTMLLNIVEFKQSPWCIKQFNGRTFFTFVKRIIAKKTTRCQPQVMRPARSLSFLVYLTNGCGSNGCVFF